jgi:hypothetical protein
MLYKHCVGSFARVLSFMQAAALGSMGSKQSFAAAIPKVYYADKVSFHCSSANDRLGLSKCFEI